MVRQRTAESCNSHCIAETVGNLGERRMQVVAAHRLVRRDEVDPHEELAGAVVAELLAVDDVAAALGQQA